MGELGGKLWGLVGLIVDVIRWSVKLDSHEGSDSFNLGLISRDQLVSRTPAKIFITLAVAVETSEK